MRLWTIIGLSAVVAATMAYAAASPDGPRVDRIHYPRDVAARIATAQAECREAAGAEMTLNPGAVRKLPLTADRRDDFILDLGKASCGGNDAFFCGRGGCTLAILVARPDGSFQNVFDDGALGYEIVRQDGARHIRISLHHAACNHKDDRPCVKEGRVRPKSLALKTVD